MVSLAGGHAVGVQPNVDHFMVIVVGHSEQELGPVGVFLKHPAAGLDGLQSSVSVTLVAGELVPGRGADKHRVLCCRLSG